MANLDRAMQSAGSFQASLGPGTALSLGSSWRRELLTGSIYRIAHDCMAVMTKDLDIASGVGLQNLIVISTALTILNP
jgi:hypothetical protein